MKIKLDDGQGRLISATIRKIVPIEKNLLVPSVSSSIDVSGGKNTIEGREKLNLERTPMSPVDHGLKSRYIEI
jgi:hypothetical protein